MIYWLVVCEWSEWEIGECSRSCGGGVRTNYRAMTTEALFTECEGEGSGDEDCNEHDCPGNNIL